VTPVLTGPVSLVAVFNDGFGTRTVVIILLDHRGAVGRLRLFDHSRTIAVPTSILMTLADRYASINGSHPNSNFIRKCRGSKGGHGCKYLRKNLAAFIMVKPNNTKDQMSLRSGIVHFDHRLYVGAGEFKFGNDGWP
jgi:hypothetical protein